MGEMREEKGMTQPALFPGETAVDAFIRNQARIDCTGSYTKLPAAPNGDVASIHGMVSAGHAWCVMQCLSSHTASHTWQFCCDPIAQTREGAEAARRSTVLVIDVVHLGKLGELCVASISAPTVDGPHMEVCAVAYIRRESSEFVAPALAEICKQANAMKFVDADGVELPPVSPREVFLDDSGACTYVYAYTGLCVPVHRACESLLLLTRVCKLSSMIMFACAFV